MEVLNFHVPDILLIIQKNRKILSRGTGMKKLKLPKSYPIINLK